MQIKGLVYCDCFEKGKISLSPEFSQLIQIDFDGGLVMLTENEEQDSLFSEWRTNACSHHNGILVEHTLISSHEELETLQDIFSMITEEAEFDCPTIYNYFLYNERIDDDLISVEDLMILIDELKNIRPFVIASSNIMFIDFFKKLTLLLLKGGEIQKPIALSLIK